MKKAFNAIKSEQFPFVQEVTKCASEKALMNLGTAYKNFFKGLGKYPQFKKKCKHDSFYVANDQFKVCSQHVRLPKMGLVKMAGFKGKIMSGTVSRSSNKWFISISVEMADDTRKSHDPHSTIGLDLGVNMLAVMSDGNVWSNPKATAKYASKIRRCSQSLARKKTGSANRDKAKTKLSKLHYQLSCVRQDHIHKLTSDLTSNYGTICMEDLNTKGLLKNKKLAKSIADASFFEIQRQLMYKSTLTNSKVVVIDRFFPSSKMCSNCGHLKQDLKLSDRTYTCNECGFSCNRDLNASFNIEKEGLNQIGWVTPELKPADICKTLIYYMNQSKIVETGKNKCV